MSKNAYPLKRSAPLRRLRPVGEGRWVSLNQFIAVAVAEKVDGQSSSNEVSRQHAGVAGCPGARL